MATKLSLSKTELTKRVARQTGWAVVDRFNGNVIELFKTRTKARKFRRMINRVLPLIVKLDLRVTGQRP